MIARVENDMRYKIFETLVKSRRMMTLSEIAKRLKTTQQRVSYHMPFLIGSGLVLVEDHKYFCQPIFLDESLLLSVEEIVADLIREISKSGTAIVVPDEVDSTDELTISCMKAIINLAIDKSHTVSSR